MMAGEGNDQPPWGLWELALRRAVPKRDMATRHHQRGTRWEGLRRSGRTT